MSHHERLRGRDEGGAENSGAASGRVRLCWHHAISARSTSSSLVTSLPPGEANTQRMSSAWLPGRTSVGVKGPKRQQSLAACRLAALVFRSALTPEHAERL